MENLIRILPRNFKTYKTSLSFTEYVLFYNKDKNERIKKYFVNDLDDKKEIPEDKISIAIVCESIEDEYFLQKNAPLVGASLSAINGIVYKECYELFKTKNTHFDNSFIDKPVFTKSQFFRYLMDYKGLRYDKCAESSFDLYEEIFRILINTKIRITIERNENENITYSGTLLPLKEISYINHRGEISPTKGFCVYRIPPILFISFVLNQSRECKINDTLNINMSYDNVILYNYLKFFIDYNKNYYSFRNYIKDKSKLYVSISLSEIIKQFNLGDHHVLRNKEKIINILNKLKDNNYFYKSNYDFLFQIKERKEYIEKLKEFDLVKIYLFAKENEYSINAF